MSPPRKKKRGPSRVLRFEIDGAAVRAFIFRSRPRRIRDVIASRGIFLEVLFSLTIGYLIGQSPLLRSVGKTGLDAWMAFDEPTAAAHVTLVAIDEADYENKKHFAGQSPLKADVLHQLLERIAALKPAVIGVDIDTSSEQYHDFQEPAGVPVVWARDARITVDEDGQERLIERNILGGQRRPAGSPYSVGLAAVPREADGVVRAVQRMIPVRSGKAESFHWSIVRSYCQQQPASTKICSTLPARESENLAVHFLRNRYRFPEMRARHLLELDENELSGNQGIDPALTPIAGKIVIVGGRYRAGGDVHFTPFGRVNGMDLIALAVETELGNAGVRKLDRLFEVLVDLLAGFVIVSLHNRLRPIPAAASTLVVVCGFTLFGSLLLFRVWSYWVDTLPVILSIWICEAYGFAKEAQHASEQG